MKTDVPTQIAPPATAPRNGLFRQEAIDFQLYDRQWGRVLLVQPVSRRLERWSLLTAVAAILTFLCFAQYARKETVTGYIKPSLGTVRIIPNQAGIVREISVREGQTVIKGQELATVETPQIGPNGEDVNVEMLAALGRQKIQLSKQMFAEAQRQRSERARLTATITSLEAQIVHLNSQVSIQTERLKLSQSMIHASGQLNAKGFLTRVEHERRQQEGLQLELNLSSLNEQMLARQSQLSETRFALDQLPIVTADRIRVLSHEQADAEQRISEIEGRRAYKLRSPVNGHVSMLQLTPGQSVDARQLQVAVIPAGSILQAEIFVPSRAIGFVHIGQPVRISYDSFPYQRYGTYNGHIAKLSDTVLSPSDISRPVAADEPMYRAIISLDQTDIDADGQKIGIRPDMLLQADVVLEKRSIMSWILSPLHATQKAIDLSPSRASLRGLSAHPTLASYLGNAWAGVQESWGQVKRSAVNSWDSLRQVFSQEAFSQRTSPDPTGQRTAENS